jgi:two-component system, LytTR family, response regulator
MSIKTLIIDDETLARALVKTFLKDHPGFEVVAEAADGFEGLRLVQEYKPDVIFLDIQMPKITGLEMLELIEKPPIIVFSTAYDQFAIDAFERNAVDYLLKPYSKERFKRAIQKVTEKIASQATSIKEVEGLQNTYAEEKVTDKVVVKNGQKIEITPKENIICIEAYGDYAWIHTAQGKFIKQQTMKSIETSLGLGFMRVHRGYIVNISFLDRLELYGKQSYKLILTNGITIDVSKSGYKDLKAVLGW